MPFGLCAIWVQLGLFGPRDKTLRFACDHSFVMIELWIQVLFIYSYFVWGLVMTMVLGFDFSAIRVCSYLTSKESPQDKILADWAM